MKCITCDKGSYGDTLIVKLPEEVALCMECVKKYPDYNTYTEGGWGVYIVGKGYVEVN